MRSMSFWGSQSLVPNLLASTLQPRRQLLEADRFGRSSVLVPGSKAKSP